MLSVVSRIVDGREGGTEGETVQYYDGWTDGCAWVVETRGDIVLEG